MQSCRALFVVSLLSGCAGAQPPEAELAPPADPSAEHVIPQTLGPGPLARVTVRLPRTYEERIAGREVTVLEALFVIDNTSTRRVEITALAIASASTRRGPLGGRRPFRVEGDRRVPPEDEGTMRARFALPRGVASELCSVELEWAIQAEGGARHTERTRFRRAPARGDSARSDARFVHAPYIPPELPV